MSNNKQSSVEWQHVELIRIDYQYAINKITPREYQEQTKNALKQAKAMHKEEIREALIDGAINSTLIEYRIPHYYEQRFGGNNDAPK